jgi:hypothetical protein
VVVGTLLGCGLAVLAVKQRSQSWRSHTTLFVTQPGFPWGRSGAIAPPVGSPQAAAAAAGLGDPQRLATLTALYAKLAAGDGVQGGLIAPTARRNESISVAAVPAPPYSSPAVLPLLNINATAPTTGRAITLAEEATTAFQSWLKAQQNAAGIDDNFRIIVQVVNHATAAVAVGHHSKALPVMIALTVLAVFIGLAFVLENVMPPERRFADAEPGTAPASRFAA